MNISNQKLRIDNTNELLSALSSPEFLDRDEDLIIECWSCGKSKKINNIVDTKKKFILYNVADRVGFIPIMDFSKNRVLVFCSHRCYLKAMNKNGEIRARRPR
jgi:hypothetical protein